MAFKTGKCIKGDSCFFPNLELRPEHSCPDCHKIVHTLCGFFDEERDKYICGCKDEICLKDPEDKICLKDVTTHDNNCLISTITASTTSSSSNYTIISKEYFIKKDQKVNHDSAKADGEKYMNLKNEITQVINDKLKTKMILKAQQIGLKKQNGEPVENFYDIGSAWKNDDSTECATMINTVINTMWSDWDGFEYEIEARVMEQFKIKYVEDQDMKGSVARMVVIRKCELAKSINKRGITNHQKRILKTRSIIKDPDEIQQKNKNAFRISSTSNSDWFNEDGSHHDENNSGRKQSFYISTIERMEQKIKELTEVTCALFLL